VLSLARNMSSVKDCRMYENKFPEVDECVMVQVGAMASAGEQRAHAAAAIWRSCGRTGE